MKKESDGNARNELREVIRYDSGGKGFKRVAYFLLFWAFLLAAVGGSFIWDMFRR